MVTLILPPVFLIVLSTATIQALRKLHNLNTEWLVYFENSSWPNMVHMEVCVLEK